jgi:hypothetical protein
MSRTRTREAVVSRVAEGLEVGVVTVSGEDDELGDAVAFPGLEQLVEGAVQGLSGPGRPSRRTLAPCQR